MSSSDLEHVHPSDLLWSHHKRASLDESEDVTHKSINFGSVENLINLYPASPRQCKHKITFTYNLVGYYKLSSLQFC